MSGFKDGGFDLTWSQASRWHGRDNCCNPEADDFLDRVWRLHLQPSGFERREHTSRAVLSVTGPGLRERSNKRIYEALRNPPPPKITRTSEPVPR